MQTVRPLRVGIMLRHVSGRGGIQVFSLRIARHIAERMPDVEPHFLYADPSQRELFADLPVKHVVLRTRSRMLWDQWYVPRYASRAGLDIILNTKFSMPLFTGARTIAALPGAEQWVVPALFPFWDRMYSRFVQPMLLRSTTAIITLTHRGRQDITRHLGVDPQRIVVVPPGIDPRMRPQPDEEQRRVRERYRLPPRFILFLGGLGSLKNGVNLVRAFSLIAADMPGVDLVFAGFRKRTAHEVFDLVGTLGLDSRVHETGYIDDADLPALYSAAECLALPSWYEGFGIPIIEAMACGCPVVTSTAGCCPEVAGGAAVLVPPDSPAQIAAGLRGVIDEPTVRQACIDRGLERSARFSWETSGRLVGELLHTLGPRRPARSRLRRLAGRAAIVALSVYLLDGLLTLALSAS